MIALSRGLRRMLAERPIRPGEAVAPTGLEAAERDRERLRRKGLLRRIHREWHEAIAANLPDAPGEVLEIGSGSGFLRETLPEVATSDVRPLPWVEETFDAAAIPRRDASLAAIVAINAVHHLPDPRAFLVEAERVVRIGGRLLMLEPWPSRWSRWIYRRLHHEPFDERGPATLRPGDPMGEANGALPWIVLERDPSPRFRAAWRPILARQTMPLCYLLSGGLSMRPLAPGWAMPAIRRFERASGLERQGLFRLLVFERISS
jgi:SAM-dependent methyltransferase